MSIYCPICNNLKSKSKNKTCGSPSCVAASGWSKERKTKHKETFNPILGGSGKRKGVKNKNPYPITEKVLARYKQCSINMRKKVDSMSEKERKAYFGNNFNSPPEVVERCNRIATENVLKQGTSKKGRFIPKNPKKYMGDPTNIIYRSMWEKKVMESLDDNLSVLRWASEEIIIPYISPIDNRRHRYFPDFYVEALSADGTLKKVLIEVKPAAQSQEPKKPERRTKRYINEVMTYGINQAKWKAAEEYCLDKGWDFMILTEKELFKKNSK